MDILKKDKRPVEIFFKSICLTQTYKKKSYYTNFKYKNISYIAFMTQVHVV